MKNESLTNKRRLNKLELYQLALSRLKECETSYSGLISFPEVFSKICRGFSIDKRRAWKLLFELRDNGYVKIIQSKGVVLK